MKRSNPAIHGTAGFRPGHWNDKEQVDVRCYVEHEGKRRPYLSLQRTLLLFSVSTRWSRSLILYLGNSMKPDEALQEQIRRYRRMTGEQRLALALNLHELSCDVAREGIRHQNPEADEAEVDRFLRERLRLTWR